MSPNRKLRHASGPSWLDFWYLAGAEPLGLWLRTPEPNTVKQRLYAARAKAGDPGLDALTVRTSPRDPDHELFIIHTSAAAGGTGDCVTEEPA